MDCHKPPAPDDETWSVIDWTAQSAWVGGTYPKGHAINYHTFTYNRTASTDPCKYGNTNGAVCNHDVTSETSQGSCTNNQGGVKSITVIVVGKNSIVPEGSDMSKCTCP